MNRQARALFALLSILPFSAALSAGLGGSLTSMRTQYRIAVRNDFTFLRTPAQVEEFVRKERLQPVESNDVLLISEVSFPYARPAVALFVERLAAQYFDATGERLVVTSLTRPISSQPRNAHELSVHPTGMAVDFRIPADANARAWLEGVFLQLERKGVLDATRERNPPHYHVAVYPEKYERYVASLPEDTTRSVRAGVELDGALEPSPGSDSAHAAEHDIRAAPTGAAPAALAIAGFGGMLMAGAVVRRRNRRRMDTPESSPRPA